MHACTSETLKAALVLGPMAVAIEFCNTITADTVKSTCLAVTALLVMLWAKSWLKPSVTQHLCMACQDLSRTRPTCNCKLLNCTSIDYMPRHYSATTNDSFEQL